jgi:hypothetical protein
MVHGLLIKWRLRDMLGAPAMSGYFRARTVVCIEDRRAGDALLACQLPLLKIFILVMCIFSIVAVAFYHVDKSDAKWPKRAVFCQFMLDFRSTLRLTMQEAERNE